MDVFGGPTGCLDRRCALMVDVAYQTLRNDSELKLCEGIRLIEATRTAIGRLAPSSADEFDRHVLPQLRQTLMDRFGLTEPPVFDVN
jgi:hypothetical protein